MTKTKLKPLFDNVIIKPLEAEEKTASGIILPENAKEKPQIGEIIAIGSGYVTQDGKTLPMVLKVGQKVLYKEWGGDRTKVEGIEYIIVKQPDVLAIVE
ncbi:MAG: co-chaperone GroES [Patescibacteria group bacterium]